MVGNIGEGAIFADEPTKQTKKYFNGVLYSKVEYREHDERWWDTKTLNILAHSVWNFYNPDDLIVRGKGDVIHHINGDPSDDRIENLMKMTRGEHTKLHLEKWNAELLSYAKLLRERGYTYKIIALRIKDKFNIKMSEASISTHVRGIIKIASDLK